MGTGCYVFWCDRIGVLIYQHSKYSGPWYDEPVTPFQYVHCSRRLIEHENIKVIQSQQSIASTWTQLFRCTGGENLKIVLEQ